MRTASSSQIPCLKIVGFFSLFRIIFYYKSNVKVGLIKMRNPAGTHLTF